MSETKSRRLRRPALRVNPVLRRELLERWRSLRAPMTLTIYLTVLGLILYLLYRIGLSVLSQQFGFDRGFGPGFGGGGPDPSLTGPAMGRFLFESLLFFVLLLVLFVAPGYAAAQLSGERERRTLSLLQVTLLSPTQIVLGKLGAAVAWLTLLIVATLPLGSAAFFLGGVTPVDLLRGIGFILVIAVCVAAMAIGASSVARKTTGAIVLTYGLVLALVGGSLFIAGADFLIRQNQGDRMRGYTPVALYANPVFGLADAVRAQPISDRFRFGFSGFDLPSPLGAMAETLPRSREDEEFFGGGQPGVFMDDGPAFEERVFLGDPQFDGPIFDDPMFDEQPPVGERTGVWLKVMGLYLAAGIGSLLVARHKVAGHQVGARVVGRRRKGRDDGTADGWPAAPGGELPAGMAGAPVPAAGAGAFAPDGEASATAQDGPP